MAAGSAQWSLGQRRQLAAVQPGCALSNDAPQQSLQEQACLLAHHAIVSLSATVLQLLGGTFGSGSGGASKVPTEAASRDGSDGGGGSSELAAEAMTRSGALDALIEALRFDMSAAGSSPVQMTKSAAAACNALAAVAGSCDAAGLEALPAQLTDALARAAVAMVVAGCDALEAATQQLSRAARRQLGGSRELRIALTGESSPDGIPKVRHEPNRKACGIECIVGHQISGQLCMLSPGFQSLEISRCAVKHHEAVAGSLCNTCLKGLRTQTGR